MLIDSMGDWYYIRAVVHCCQRTYNIYRINLCANFHRSVYYQTSWFYHLHVKTIGPDLGVSDWYANHINATGLYLNCKNHEYLSEKPLNSIVKTCSSGMQFYIPFTVKTYQYQSSPGLEPLIFWMASKYANHSAKLTWYANGIYNLLDIEAILKTDQIY